MMKAIQSTGKIDHEGKLSLDHPLPGTFPRAVRVIILFEEIEAEDIQISPDHPPTAMTSEELQHQLQQALTVAGYDSREKVIQLVQDVKQEIAEERQQKRH